MTAGPVRWLTAALILASWAAISCRAVEGKDRTGAESSHPRVSRPLPWHGEGVWLQGDTHTHNMMRHANRGRRMIKTAVSTGLDFVATTEHSELAFSPATIPRFEMYREDYPEFVLLTGIEWNVPGAGHATVLTDGGPKGWRFLLEFARRFDRRLNPELLALRPAAESETEEDDAPTSPTWGDKMLGVEALRWLTEQADLEGHVVSVYLNHPGKRNWLTAEEIEALAAAGMNGLAAAPGHQNSDPLYGDYTIDRHEPLVAEVGGGYDRLLGRGVRLGLSAGSDFHTKNTSYLPGVFSRTLVYARNRSAAGVVEALRAGATATVLGGIASRVESRLGCPGFDDAAAVAETLSVAPGTTVRYVITAEVPEFDFEDRPNRIDRVEVVSDCGGEPRIVHVADDLGDAPGAVRVEFELPGEFTERTGTCFLRARGRRFVGGAGNGTADADFLFHVAPTWLEVAGPAG